MSQCVSFGQLPSTGYGADHIENTPSVVFLLPLATDHSRKHSVSIVMLLHRVPENVFSVRCIATVRMRTAENTAPVF
jgi:hypothetical protein